MFTWLPCLADNENKSQHRKKKNKRAYKENNTKTKNVTAVSCHHGGDVRGSQSK